MKTLSKLEINAVSGGLTSAEIIMGTTMAGTIIPGTVGMGIGLAEGGMLAGLAGPFCAVYFGSIGMVSGLAAGTAYVVGSKLYAAM